MAVSLTIHSDVEKAAARLRALGRDVGQVFHREDFGNAVQSYITGATTRFMRKMGNVGDAPARKEGRGETWPGFAVWKTRKYGREVQEGTRFYMRGFARGEASPVTIAKRAEKARGMARMGSAALLTKAWKKRASGVSYSASSKMLQDTGALRGFTAFVRRRVRGSGKRTTMVLTAGEKPKYFREQHERRPIWFWYPPEDVTNILKLLARFIRQTIGKLQRGAG